MNIEKEYRYVINKFDIQNIKANTKCICEPENMIDIVLGYYGFESLEKLNYICRIRIKGDKKILECKKKSEEDNIWIEQDIKLESVKEGYSFLSLMGLKPYLYINRTREVRETSLFKIFIDSVDLLGDFLEIEFKDPELVEPLKELNMVLDEWGIPNCPQKLYGDIFKEKIENDIGFEDVFIKALHDIVNKL